MTPGPDDQAAAAAPLARDRFRVAMADTDAAQVIYFGAPMRWAERLMTTWLADVKFPTSQFLAAGFGTPAVHAELTYRSPLRLDDPVEGTLWLHRKSARSVTWRAEFTGPAEPTLAVEVLLTQVHVRIEEGGATPVPWPAALFDLLGEQTPRARSIGS